MEAYKFETTIQKDGIFHIPEMAQWAKQRVEVFVVIQPMPELELTQEKAITTFIERWCGILEGYDPDQLRLQYLQEKYA